MCIESHSQALLKDSGLKALHTFSYYSTIISTKELLGNKQRRAVDSINYCEKLLPPK